MASGNSPNLSKLHIAGDLSRDDVTSVNTLQAYDEAHINKQTDDGVTPLMLAAAGCNVDVMECLIRKGANICISDNVGKNALHFAIEHGSIESVQLLLRQFAKAPEMRKKFLNAVADLGMTPLLKAVEINFIPAVKLLIEAQVYLNAVTDDRYTALHIAAEKKYANIVAMLIKHKAALDIQNVDGATPLMLATKRNHIYIVGLLVNARADVSQCDQHGNTPVHIAAKYGYLEVITCLIQQGHCDLSTKNRENQTPLDLSDSVIVTDLLKNPSGQSKHQIGRNIFKCDTVRHVQNASVTNIKKTIHDSYSRLSNIGNAIKVKRTKKRKPLSCIYPHTQVKDRVEEDGAAMNDIGNARADRNVQRSRSISIIEQNQSDTSADDTDDGFDTSTECGTQVIERCQTFKKEVQVIEKDLRDLTDNTSPTCDWSDGNNWLDIFRHPSQQKLEGIFQRVNKLEMDIEALQSMVSMLARTNGSSCGLQSDSSFDYGDLSDQALHQVARQLGKEWISLGVVLGLSHSQISRFECNHPRDLLAATWDMLITWRNSHSLSNSEKKANLIEALKKVNRQDIAESL